MVNSLLLLQIAAPVPLRRLFDYLPPINCDAQQLQPGIRIRIPFGRRTLTGIFIGLTQTASVPTNKLRTALEILDTEPVIPPELLTLATQAAQYYHHPIGEVLTSVLPTTLRQGKPIPIDIPHLKQHSDGITNPSLHTLNLAQTTAVSAIQQALTEKTFKVFLLEGVTGSGKTEVYLEAIATTLAENKQALILVPEINLTPQTITRFRTRFSVPIIALHSGMTPKARLLAWCQAKTGAAKIIIGTRSAIFAPLNNLGLIVIDEEHDISFKQQEGFRYHARDVAILRAKALAIPIIVGSATPSLETLHNAALGRYHPIQLPERAGTAIQPTWVRIDLRNHRTKNGLSAILIDTISEHLNIGNQVLLFLNRRGFAPILLCHACGWVATCQRCDMRMTLHKQTNLLLCHHCEAQKKIPQQCEQCAAKQLQTAGQGTEKLEETLTKLFPTFPIVRIDRDSTKRKGQMEHALQQIMNGDARILTGTQMLAKGHHFPNVTLVAIIDADNGFFSSDFRALERMGQFILQAGGRAGRADKPGTVMIQTHQPDHPLLSHLLQDSYAAFATALLSERAAATLPPFTHFALFRAEALHMEKALTFLETIKNLQQTPHVHLLGPIPAPMPRRAGRYRAQLLLQSHSRPALQAFLTQLTPRIETLPTGRYVRWSLDVDPLEIL